ncbi:MAG: glycosyltransferase family 10 [Patescibacteria group bacterium]
MSENKMGKKILIQVPSPFAANNAIFEQDANNMTEPWRVLKARLNSLGYEVLTADNNSLEDCEWLLFIDSLSLYGTAQRGGFKNFARRISNKIFKVKDKNPWPNRPLYEEAMARGMENRMALFLWEGAVVSPYNYMPKTWKKFNRIFTWKDDLVDNKKFFKFYLPTPTQNGIVKPLPFAQKKLLVNISANKWYPGENELFSARVRTSLYFDRHYPNDFDHFGARWHTAVTRWQKYFPALIPKFTTYRGKSGNKMETLSKYKFSLCYENVSDNKGYITEKIFDILQAKSVPVYWGAPNIEEYVPSTAFVDRRKFINDEALAKYLKNVSEENYEKMVEAGQKYLETENCKKFFSEYFAKRVIEVLNITRKN